MKRSLKKFVMLIFFTFFFSVCFGEGDNDESRIKNIDSAGFESEAGAIIKYDTMISNRLIFRMQEAYHFRKKVFGIMLGIGLVLN